MNVALLRVLVLTPLAGALGALGAAFLLPRFIAADTVAAALGFVTVSVLGAISLIGRGRKAARSHLPSDITPIRANAPVGAARPRIERDARLAA